MKLAKPHFDVGLFTHQCDPSLAFWEETVGLEYDHMAKLGGGVQQHRFLAHGSIIKVNHARDELPSLPAAGWRELLIATEGETEAVPMDDPDGNPVTLVPPGLDGVTGIAVRMVVNDPDATDRFYREVMQFESPSPGVYRCGDSLLIAGPGQVKRSDGWRGLGYRYITVQVYDCLAEHAGALARGGMEGQSPVVLGDTVRFSFLRDPDGNFIEISQRTSLTGEPLL